MGSGQPNIVLVMSDDQGWGDAGYQGNPILKTPHLDTFAADAVRLDRFYAQAPVCSPTRGSCVTGRHPFRYGIRWADIGALPEHEVSLGRLLQGAGYRTGHFGKWHLGTLSRTVPDASRGGAQGSQYYAPPWDRGFDVCFSTESRMPTYNPMVWGGGRWQVASDPADASTLRGASNQQGFKQIMDRPVAYDERPETHPVDLWHGSYWRGEGRRVESALAGDDSAVVVEEALEFIDGSVAADSPFLALVWFHTPHTPIAAGDQHRAPYHDHPIEAQHFYGSLTAMDEQVGRLRGELDRLGVLDDTILWFCSDNGPSYIHDFNSAGGLRGKKATLWEGGIRVPGIFSWPKRVSGGRKVSAPMVTSDFVPTILKAAGVVDHDLPVFDGVDVMPLLSGDRPERGVPIPFLSPMRGADPAIAGDDDMQLALIDDRYKISSMDDGVTYELHDLIEDEAEEQDLAAEQPERLGTMRATLEQWRRQVQPPQ